MCVCVCVCVKEKTRERENEREREREREQQVSERGPGECGAKTFSRRILLDPTHWRMEERINFLRATSREGFAPRLKAQKTTQNGCCRAGVVPNPEFTPRNVPHYQSFLILARGRPKRDPLWNILFAFPPKGGRGSESTVTAMPCLLLEDL